MSHREYDPLAAIPRPEVVREKLNDVERIAQRLRTLLRVSEEIHEDKEGAKGVEVANVR
jgi:hypothetical protein